MGHLEMIIHLLLPFLRMGVTSHSILRPTISYLKIMETLMFLFMTRLQGKLIWFPRQVQELNAEEKILLSQQTEASLLTFLILMH